jgi:hypothetical protein
MALVCVCWLKLYESNYNARNGKYISIKQYEKEGYEVLPWHLSGRTAVNNEKRSVIVHTPDEVQKGHLQNRSQKRRRLKHFGQCVYVKR